MKLASVVVTAVAAAVTTLVPPSPAQEPDADAILRTAMERHGSRVLDRAEVEYRLFGVDFLVLHDGGHFRYEHRHDGGPVEVMDNDWVHRDRGTIDYRAIDFALPGAGRRTQNFDVAVSPRRISGVLFTDWVQHGPSPEVGRRIEDYPERWEAGALEETGRFEPRRLRVTPLGDVEAR